MGTMCFCSMIARRIKLTWYTSVFSTKTELFGGMEPPDKHEAPFELFIMHRT